MPDQANSPAVVSAGVNPNDGHEHFWSPRNIIAFGIVAAMIASVFLPYFVIIPNGRGGDLVFSGAEKLLTVAMLVIAFYFGTTVNSQRDRETIRQQALSAPPAPDPAAAPLEIKPPAKIILEEPEHAQGDAERAAQEPAGLPAPPGLQPRSGRPAE